VSAEFGLQPERGTPSMQVSQAGSQAGGLERQRLQALQQVSAAASRVLDPGELARITVDETIRILAPDRAFLFLVNADTGGLDPYLGRNAAGEDLPELTGYSISLVERVRNSGQQLVITGTEEGAALGAESVVLHGLRSIMAAPLLLEGRVLGVVSLDSQVAEGIFTADDAGILNALTNHIAHAWRCDAPSGRLPTHHRLDPFVVTDPLGVNLSRSFGVPAASKGALARPDHPRSRAALPAGHRAHSDPGRGW
jgi:hypothetical protein